MATIRMAGLWRDPRTGILTLRRRIPIKLRAAAAAAGHKAETVKLSTGTADKREAEQRLPEIMQRFRAKLAEWENQANAVTLTPEQAQQIAAAWADRAESVEQQGVSAAMFDHLVTVTDPAMVPGVWARVEHHAGEALRLAGIGAITPASRTLLCEALEPRVQQAYHRAEDRRAWQQAPVASTVSLRSLFDAWKPLTTVKPRVVADTRYMVEMLTTFLGHDDAARIGPADLRRWRDAMKAEGRSNNTWNNRLSMIRQVFAFGVSEGKLKANPTDGLRLKKARQQSPLPYTDDEAARLLLAARRETSPALRWAPWIMAFTGMRAGEVLQLLGQDIRQDGGLWCIDVNEEAEGKSVKTGQRRHVPVHPALVAEGFIAYARNIAADAPLFPDKALDKHGNRGGRAWNYIGKWARKLIADPRKAPNHSWRHRMEDELRAAEVPEDARDAILGHARRTTGRVYGVRGEALTRLHRYLSKVPAPPGC